MFQFLRVRVIPQFYTVKEGNVYIVACKTENDLLVSNWF